MEFFGHGSRDGFQSIRTLRIGNISGDSEPSNRDHGRCHLGVYRAHVGECRPACFFCRPRAPHFSRIRSPPRRAPDRRRSLCTDDHRGTRELWACGETGAPTPCFSIGIGPNDVQGFQRVSLLTDATLGDIAESYEGQGGLARAYVGVSRGWRGRRWNPAGSTDSVLVNTWELDAGLQADHWFGDAIQSAFLDIEDVSFRDVRTSISSRHRASGFILCRGVQNAAGQVQRIQGFSGQLDAQIGRNLESCQNTPTQTTPGWSSPLSFLVASSRELIRRPLKRPFSMAVPQKWTLGGGLQWDRPSGSRFGVFVDHHKQSWSSSQATLDHLMEGEQCGTTPAAWLSDSWSPREEKWARRAAPLGGLECNNPPCRQHS